MEYKVISACSTAQLSKDVTDALAKGWEPKGGLLRADVKGGLVFMQAVVTTELDNAHRKNTERDCAPSGD